MKIYATATSERATKGQGGNEYMDVLLSVGSEKDSVPVLEGTIVAIKTGGYMLSVRILGEDTKQFRIGSDGKTKGKQQEGECKYSGFFPHICGRGECVYR